MRPCGAPGRAARDDRSALSYHQSRITNHGWIPPPPRRIQHQADGERIRAVARAVAVAQLAPTAVSVLLHGHDVPLESQLRYASNVEGMIHTARSAAHLWTVRRQRARRLERFLLSSVGRRVVSHARAFVLVLPPSGNDASREPTA